MYPANLPLRIQLLSLAWCFAQPEAARKLRRGRMSSKFLRGKFAIAFTLAPPLKIAPKGMSRLAIHFPPFEVSGRACRSKRYTPDSMIISTVWWSIFTTLPCMFS